MGINLRNTEISTLIPCESEPATLEEAQSFLSILEEQPIYRRLSALCLSDVSIESVAKRLVLLDCLFREVRPMTVIGDSNYMLQLLTWLYCPSCDELIIFSNRVGDEQVCDIMCEVLFTRHVLGEPSETIPASREGAEFAWTANDNMLMALMSRRIPVILFLSCHGVALPRDGYGVEVVGDACIFRIKV